MGTFSNREKMKANKVFKILKKQEEKICQKWKRRENAEIVKDGDNIIAT